MQRALRSSPLHVAVLLAVAALAGLAVAQSPPVSQPQVSIQPRPNPNQPAEDRHTPNIRVDTKMVQVNVTVVTPLNQLVTGLEKSHFRLIEDGVEQSIASLSMEDVPLSVGLVFDISGSMTEKLQSARRAASEFFRLANSEDEFFLVQFNNAPQLVVPWTRHGGDIQSKLAFTKAKGNTALFDGVYLALEQMRSAHNPRKALLIISDGGDNSSRYSETEVRNRVREADVQIYGIGIFGGGSPEELGGPGLLNSMASQSGGRSFNILLGTMADIAGKIAMELRNQYVLGYYPTNGVSDGKYRRVEVLLKKIRGMPELRPYYRTGYYAPIE